MNTNRNTRQICAVSFGIYLMIGCVSLLRAQVYERLFSFTDAHAEDVANSLNKGYSPGYLLQGSDGNFYGTTEYGGTGAGTVFRMDPAGTVATLHSFNIVDGATPLAPLVQASNGYIY